MFRTPHAMQLSHDCKQEKVPPIALFLLFALLVTASFAYQAGNNFELTAGMNKTSHASVSHASHASQPGKHPNDTNAVLPNSPDVLAAAVSLLIIYVLAARGFIFWTPYRQLLKSSLLMPLKFSSMYVDFLYPSYPSKQTFQL